MGTVWKRVMSGGVIGIIGFLLSPLSWWNDAFINLPLALGFGWLVALLYPRGFEVGVIVGYWLTNVLGFVLLHKGASRAFHDLSPRYSWKHFRHDLLISLTYTGLIILLIHWKVLQPLENYFPKAQSTVS